MDTAKTGKTAKTAKTGKAAKRTGKTAKTTSAGSPPLDVAAEVRALTAALAAHADPERARFEKAYMKTQLEVLGAGQTAVRKLAVEWSRAHPGLEAASLRALGEALIRSDVFDLRSVGIAVLAHQQKRLTRADLPWLVELCRHCAAWAHVDWLATDPISDIVGRDPGALPILRVWAKDPSFWVRRTALLAQLRQFMRGAGDFDLFAEISVPMLHEKEFFIRKAIGWALRSLSRKRPAPVLAYVAAHGDRMSGVTWREAVKYLDLPEGQRRPSKQSASPARKQAAKKVAAKSVETVDSPGARDSYRPAPAPSGAASLTTWGGS